MILEVELLLSRMAISDHLLNIINKMAHPGRALILSKLIIIVDIEGL
jgi:hypothetical protein